MSMSASRKTFKIVLLYSGSFASVLAESLRNGAKLSEVAQRRRSVITERVKDPHTLGIRTRLAIPSPDPISLSKLHVDRIEDQRAC
ncbi:hypothetical protein C8R42DRAFT_690521 [Lentinula raphanica]|nr:hypothetical protein C8R42DRAFT_690521 [Lentinula raphanica]